jgi:hypothetical protein
MNGGHEITTTLISFFLDNSDGNIVREVGPGTSKRCTEILLDVQLRIAVSNSCLLIFNNLSAAQPAQPPRLHLQYSEQRG